MLTEEQIENAKKLGIYYECTNKPTCLGCRREKAYINYKTAGTDWARYFWAKTYQLIQYKYSTNIKFNKWVESNLICKEGKNEK